MRSPRCATSLELRESQLKLCPGCLLSPDKASALPCALTHKNSPVSSLSPECLSPQLLAPQSPLPNAASVSCQGAVRWSQLESCGLECLQAQAQAQAQQAAVEAHQLDAAAQQLQAEAHAVVQPLPALPVISTGQEKVGIFLSLPCVPPPFSSAQECMHA